MLIADRFAKKQADIIIGCFVRDDIFAELSLECNAIKLNSANAKDILTSEPLDLLLYQSPPIQKYDDIETLTSLCKRRRIPCVYWDTDGYIIFNANAQCIKLFDYVFTTDKGLIEKYKKILSHNNVFHLPKAIQPKLFLPIEQTNLSDNELKALIYSSSNAKLYLEELQKQFQDNCQYNNINPLLEKCKDAFSKNYLISLRTAFSYNTYTERISKLLYTTGIIISLPEPVGVSVIATAKTAEDIDTIISNYERQVYPIKELIIAYSGNENDIKMFFYKLDYLDDVTLVNGAFLNTAVSMSKYAYISVFDINNYYCCNFLTDLMLCFKYTNADIVGKLAFYKYHKALNQLELINYGLDYCYSNSICNYSAVFNKLIFSDIKFDEYNNFEKFIKDAVEKSYMLYSADRFNFASICQNKCNDSINLNRWLKPSPVDDSDYKFINHIAF